MFPLLFLPKEIRGVDPAMVAQIVQQVMSQLGVNTNADCPQSDLVRVSIRKQVLCLLKAIV